MVGKGFVDVQLNGLMGLDFTQPGLTLDDVRKVTNDLLAKGTIAYCPTICTGSLDMYEENLKVFAQAMKDPELSGHLLGVHLEGPFISPVPGAVGAHQTEYVIDPSIETFDKFMEWSDGNISILTIAPERPGAEELIRHASKLGTKVLMGHQLADDATMEKAVAAGACGSTHLGNGLPNDIHRHKNPMWFQLACDDLWSTLITDGHHLPSPFIKVALRAKPLDKVVIISDAGPLAQMPVGIYDGFGKKIEVEPSGRLSCYGTGYLAGSHSTMIECMNFLASLNLLSEEELWQVGYTNPLRLLGKSPDSLEGVSGPEVSFDGKEFSVQS